MAPLKTQRKRKEIGQVYGSGSLNTAPRLQAIGVRATNKGRLVPKTALL